MFKSFAAAIAFYTIIPIPHHWSLDFRYVSRSATVVGLGIGGVLATIDFGLTALDMPSLTRSAVLVGTWLALTGGLHMDGAMDTADGLAVTSPEKRLAVMADSHTGAFGAMVVVAILGLKWATLADLQTARLTTLLLAPMWGRWAQQVAIAAYPYLKPTGKGAFHKAAFSSIWLVVGSGCSCALFSLGLWIWSQPELWDIASWGLLVARLVGIVGVAIATGAWFNAKLGGHTGDTYGAVVEWTEVGVLVLLGLL